MSESDGEAAILTHPFIMGKPSSIIHRHLCDLVFPLQSKQFSLFVLFFILKNVEKCQKSPA